MSDWKTLSSEVVYETSWIKVHRDQALDQNGKPVVYSYMVLQNPSVHIVAVNSEGKILLQSVYRYTLKKRVLEIPAGYIEVGEEPLAAAQRELAEETNLKSDHWTHLGRIYQIIGTGKVPNDIFLAEEVYEANATMDEGEDITDRRFESLADIETMIADGRQFDSPVISSLYMAKIHGIAKGGT